MPSLGELQGQMGSAKQRLSQYTKDLPGQIESQITEAWTPTLERATGETQRQMSEFLPRFWEGAGMGPGMQQTSAAGLSPSQKLGVMGRELGTMGGRLTASQRVSDYLGGQMKDMYGKAIEAMRFGQKSAADEYSRAFQEYQLAFQAAEREKDRALQRSMRAGSGGRIVMPGMRGGADPRRELESIARGGITWGQRRAAADAIIGRYPGIDRAEAYRAAGFSDHWNPAYSRGGMAAGGASAGFGALG